MRIHAFGYVDSSRVRPCDRDFRRKINIAHVGTEIRSLREKIHDRENILGKVGKFFGTSNFQDSIENLKSKNILCHITYNGKPNR